MKSFYSQQILATLALVALWALALGALDRQRQTPFSHERLAIKAAPPEQQNHIVTEPRDPATTGETARVHHKDGFGNERKTEVSFADHAKSVVEYSIFGKPFRVTETKKDGSCQVFQLDPMGSKLVRIESKRPDGTLKTSMRPVEPGTFERVFFKENGSTMACRQRIKSDGSLSSDIFDADGTTLLAQFTIVTTPAASAAEPTAHDHESGEATQTLTATLKVFDKSGKVVREETLTRTEGDNSSSEYEHYEGGSQQETLNVKVFWENGKVRYEQEWQCYSGNVGSLQSVIEYDQNGTKLQSLGSCSEKIGDTYSSQRLDTYNAEGKVVRSQYISHNRTVLMDKVIEGGTEKVTNPKGVVLELPAASDPSYKTLPQDFLNLQMEPNRVGQVLSAK